jgi:sorbitol-specific phosphotransferase system component IIBC
MAKLFTKKQDTAQRVKATYADTKDATQELLVRAKKTARSTAVNAKDRVQKTFASAKGTAQDKLAKTKNSTQSTSKTTRNAAQDRLAKVQHTTKVWLDKALDLLVTGVSIVVALFYENQRRAQKKLKQARASLLKTATPIAEKTQDVVVSSTKKASQSLQKAAANAKDAQESLQDWYEDYQRKRRRNRMLFRIGLFAGLALALFSTPLAGSDVRQYIVQRWRQYRSYFGK